MSLQIVIPVRPLGEGKSRLAPVLARSARARLVERMYRHVLGLAEHCGEVSVVSRDPRLRAVSERPVEETGHDLNAALEQAAATLRGGSPVLVLSADLPLLTDGDLGAMTALLDRADIVAAPDRAGTGTNALLFARPGLMPYRFGPGSLAAHRTGAFAQGLRFETCARQGLATDIDQPADLALLPPAWLIP